MSRCGDRPATGTDRRHAIATNGRVLESDQASEIFLTLTPDAPRSAPEQARDLFTAVRDALGPRRARLVQERVFATEAAMPEALRARAAAYGDLDDGIPPVLLSIPAGHFHPVAGVQVHAVSGPVPEVIRGADGVLGRRVDAGGLGYTALSGIASPQSGERTGQAKSIYEKALASLQAAGGSMLNVARTWLWLGDILAWYDDFNGVRNCFFRECGLLGRRESGACLPASTGIGVRPAGGAACSLDVIALLGPNASVEYRHAAGMQQSAYNYGSAFSRAAKATTPAGVTIYVSGTAAIDEAGKTCHAGDAKAQIRMTMENARAAMKDLGAADADVVQAIAYSKTPEVEEMFLRDWGHLGWPTISVLSDICRDDLLFEVEATACPGSRRL